MHKAQENEFITQIANKFREAEQLRREGRIKECNEIGRKYYNAIRDVCPELMGKVNKELEKDLIRIG